LDAADVSDLEEVGFGVEFWHGGAFLGLRPLSDDGFKVVKLREGNR
jgi:hypothetical protein